MAPRTVAIAFHITQDEHDLLAVRAEQAGMKSPSLYLRALYRESLQTPDNLRRAQQHGEVLDAMRHALAKLAVDYLRTITPEELLGSTRQE
jgi:hypothetical protein